MTASAPGYSSGSQQARVSSGAITTVEIRLQPLPGTLRVRVVDAATGTPIQGAAVSYGTAASTAAGDEQPCADYALLVPLKRSREYRVIRSRVVDPRPADAWQQDGLHLFVFELRPIDAAGTAPPDPPVAVFAMRPEPGELVSAVVVTPRPFEEPEVTPVQV